MKNIESEKIFVDFSGRFGAICLPRSLRRRKYSAIKRQKERSGRHFAPMSRTLLLARARVAPGGAFAHHVSDLVDGLTAFYARRRRSAQRASRMVKVLLYGYGDVFVTKEEAGGGRGVPGVGGGKLSESSHAVRVSPSVPGGWVVRGGGGARGLRVFGKLSIDGTKVRANASKRKAMSYGARGGAALEGGSVAECGGGRTLWRVVAAGTSCPRSCAVARTGWRRRRRSVRRNARRVRAPARSGSVKADGHRGRTRGQGAEQPSPTVPRPAPRGSSTTRRWRANVQLIVATDEQCKRPRAGLRGRRDLRRAARDGAWPGYCNERDLSALEARGIDVAPGREGKRTVNRDPRTHPVTLVESWPRPRGRERYAQRKWLRPMVKEVLGFRRFSVRGPDKAQGDLVCLALNVKRLQPLLAGCLFVSETWPEASGVLRPVPYAPTAVSRRSYPSHASNPRPRVLEATFLRRRLLALLSSRISGRRGFFANVQKRRLDARSLSPPRRGGLAQWRRDRVRLSKSLAVPRLPEA